MGRARVGRRRRLDERGGHQPYYSGGITLDHESPDTVYLSRQVDGVFEIETLRTPDGGTTWSSTAITAASERTTYGRSPPGGWSRSLATSA